jgi:predicted nucleic acid-binding protein
MIGFDAVFIDSVAFIYLIENDPKYFDRVSRFISREIENKNQLIISVIAISDFCVKPFRENDIVILSDFKEALEQLDIRVLDINFKIAEYASKLRAKYKFLKTADALQIASSLSSNCKRFLTNDFQLKSIQEIEVILIEDLN